MSRWVLNINFFSVSLVHRTVWPRTCSASGGQDVDPSRIGDERLPLHFPAGRFQVIRHDFGKFSWYPAMFIIIYHKLTFVSRGALDGHVFQQKRLQFGIAHFGSEK